MSTGAVVLIIIAVLVVLAAVVTLIVTRRARARSASARMGLPPLGALTGQPLDGASARQTQRSHQA